MPDIHVSRIDPHPANIREDLGDLAELTASIRVHGIVQPLVVEQASGRYRLLAGHRRLAAAKRARLEMVPCVIRPAPGSRAIEVMLVENCQRRDLGPVEKAEAMGALRNYGLSVTDIARRIGLHPSSVSGYLAYLDLDEATRQRVKDGTVKAGDAVRAVRKSRKKARGGTTGRPVQAEPAWLAPKHRLAAAAAAMCGHTRRPQVGSVACGQCWEQAIRDDHTEPEPELEPLTRRQERIEQLAEMRLYDGNGRPDTPDIVTAAEAAERLGVTPRTVERYKRDLALAGAS